jgi:DNA-binding CsgD family transcriptional regulator/transcriptional regulator with GAF, ATPase, and Fis domain
MHAVNAPGPFLEQEGGLIGMSIDTATSGSVSRQVLEAVYDIGETFTRTLHLQPVLNRIVAEARALAKADSCSIMLTSDTGDEMIVAAAEGPRAQFILGKRQPVTAGLAGRAVREGLSIIDGRSHSDSAFPQDVSRSALVPLRVAERLVGVLNLSCESDPSRLGHEVVSLLQLLAYQAAISIETARLYEELGRKERRLEFFVDRMLRMQSEEKRAAGPSEAQLESIFSNVMRRTLEEVSAAPQTLPSEHGTIVGTLTDREREVLFLMVEGLTNKEIGRRLHIKVGTVKNHVLHVMSKLGAFDRTQAAVIAIRTGLLS